MKRPDAVAAGDEPAAFSAARAWLRSGRAVVPIPYGTKAPTLPNWPTLRITEGTLSQYFNGGEQNIGVLLGEASRGLVDVDLDVDEAVRAVAYFLPDTYTYGRERRPESHRLYVCPVARTKQWKHDGAVLLELRSTGCQSVIPPSVHPEGDRYFRDASSAPTAEIDLERLLAGLGRTAAAALIAVHWRESSRHALALALSGALLHAGWEVDDVAVFIEAVAAAAQDDEPADRLRAVQDTGRDFSADKAVTGWPRLAEHLQADVIERVREWLGVRAFPDLVADDAEPSEKPGLVMVQTSTVRPGKLSPLWPGVLWHGKPTLIVGDPGKGKSLVTLDIAARISTGAPWPCSDERRKPGTVLLISAEDDLSDTIVPRLEAAGADRRNVHFIGGVRGADGRIDWLSLDRHWQQLADGVRGLEPDLLVVDPLSAFMGRADSNNEGDVRRVLAGVAELAQQSRAAVLAVRHFRKGSADTAQGRVIGSVAFTAAARAVYAVTPDPDDEERRLLLCLKCNLAADTAGYSFEVAVTAAGDPHVAWSAERETRTAEEVLGSADKRGSVDDAVDWLEDALAAGPVPQKDLEQGAKRAGHSWATVRRAQKRIGAVAEHVGGRDGRWEWRTRATTKMLNASVGVERLEHLGGGQEPEDAKASKVLNLKTGVEHLGAELPSEAPDQLPLHENPYQYPCLNCRGKGCRFCDPQLDRR